MYHEKKLFSRNERLLGTQTMTRISRCNVILFGTGGVGSWCTESLIRSGVRYLTIVDSDCISLSNINRQLPATTETVGQAKVEVLKERLLSVNPYAKIEALKKAYTADTAETFNLGSYDYIIDAIDSLEHKASLIVHATHTQATLFSSMGAALKIDPSRIRTAEFWKVNGCPLAAALRRKMRRNTMPAKEFLCVFSDELLENKGSSGNTPGKQSTWDEKKATINGTVAHTTAIFGFTLAGLVIQDIAKR